MKSRHNYSEKKAKNQLLLVIVKFNGINQFFTQHAAIVGFYY